MTEPSIAVDRSASRESGGGSGGEEGREGER
jgi:hypothetical protein